MGYHYPSNIPTQHPTQLMPNRAGCTVREEGGCLLCRLEQHSLLLCCVWRTGRGSPGHLGLEPSPPERGWGGGV